MIYELWEIASFGEGDFHFLLLNNKFEDFRDAYFAFQQLIKIKPCCIVLTKGEIK